MTTSTPPSSDPRYLWLLTPFEKMTKAQLLAVVRKLMPETDEPCVLMTKTDFDKFRHRT